MCRNWRYYCILKAIGPHKFVILSRVSGLYFHIPFCKQACAYCDFHFSTNLDLKPRLVSAMRQELQARAGYLPSDELATVYFGGGSPSLLTETELQSLMNAVSTLFRLKNGAEVSLEANPDDMQADKLGAWLEVGINRLSVGVQSFNNEELQWMNRAHHAQQAYAALNTARSIGFKNISIDVIYGSKYQSEESWKDTVDQIIFLNPEHISAYNLTVEDKTRLGLDVKKGKEPAVDEGLSSWQFLYLTERLQAAGYLHYEISNFAKPGFHSQHNSSYWQQLPYLGIGPSAHSFNGDSRQWNLRNNHEYVRAITQAAPHFEIEHLSIRDRFNEYVMTGFRTSAGCNLDYVLQQFGPAYYQHFMECFQKQTQSFCRQNEQVWLSTEARLHADGIAASFFLLEEPAH